jgi:L-2-hydroxyglutarate oxidase LhgO
MEKTEAVVIGAGVVGLACARALARRGIETLIVERHATIGSETSARNSEVMHAGLYYPPGSLKAELCIAGQALLYDFCQRHHVAHRRCGKLIVATGAAQEAGLQALQATGAANGVTGLQLLSRQQAQALEPQLACAAALLSPNTGIVDSHALMLALLGDAEAHGANLARCTPLQTAELSTSGGHCLHLGGEEPMTLGAELVINAAGLNAPSLAGRFSGLDAAHLPNAHFAKGNYYALAGQAPFSRLIYPLPEAGGLGVHLTLDLGGQARFGPDVEWLAEHDDDAPDYRVCPQRADAFYAEVRRYWPQLPAGALSPAYAGIRPKIAGPGQPAADFLIQGPATHGIAGLVNLFGIESPGLTASLAIGERVCTSLGL